MTARISPAPWTAHISTSELDGNVYTIGEIAHAPAGPYRGGVARLQSAEHIVGIGADEVIANAHLIAAAPDLLEALERLVDSVSGLSAGVASISRDARAAIAKARGQS